jgi:hypothetical protein
MAEIPVRIGDIQGHGLAFAHIATGKLETSAEIAYSGFVAFNFDRYDQHLEQGTVYCFLQESTVGPTPITPDTQDRQVRDFSQYRDPSGLRCTVEASLGAFRLTEDEISIMSVGPAVLWTQQHTDLPGDPILLVLAVDVGAAQGNMYRLSYQVMIGLPTDDVDGSAPVITVPADAAPDPNAGFIGFVP